MIRTILNSKSTLFSIGKFDFRLNHLLVIGILSLSFSMSFMVRSLPADHGWELHEFDPFFNYRATQFILENGIDDYFQWRDELSMYPHGRDVSKTSQVMLHLTAATTYSIFGNNGDLYDFTILFPVVFGSLSCIVIFALVRVIGGTIAGLFSALLFSVSLPVLIRGLIGWFKSEPLGLFFSLLAIYLFLSGIKSKNNKIAFIKLISAGILLCFGLSAWGGDQFFIIPLGIFIFVLPFIRKDHKFLIWAIPIFSSSIIGTSLVFERFSTELTIGLAGFSIIIPTIFLVSCILIQMKSNEASKTRNGLILLVSTLIIASVFLIVGTNSDFIHLPSFRYQNALNPFLTTSDPLVDSVSEHATTSIETSFLYHSVLMIFAGIGIWLILTNSKKYNFVKTDMLSFSLILGITGVYVSSTFVRLEIFAALGVIILSSLGLAIFSKEFLLTQNTNKIKNLSIKSSFFIGIFLLLTVPLVYPTNGTVFGYMDNPPTILNGGTIYRTSVSDWNDSLEWIKNNTPDDSVVASWWDYGYWIQTKSERATLADNSTLDTEIIQNIAKILLSNPTDGWKSLQDAGAEYFVIFIAGQRLNVDSADGQPVYVLGGGADESKKQWFMRIANEPVEKYLESDRISGTDYFWNETLLGQMTPFKLLGYYNLETNQQSLSYIPGFTGLYTKETKFSENDPFMLVYSSPSFEVEKGGYVIGVFVYEVNEYYVPEN